MSLYIPVLGYTDESPPEGDVHGLIIGTQGLTLDGKSFPWMTVDDWTVTFTEDGVAKLNVSIVVTLPKDPSA